MSVLRRREPGEHQVLSTTTIVLWGAGLILLASDSVTVLWMVLDGEPRDTVRLDVVRTSASILVGTGGTAALLLAARKQRSTELDAKQKDHDATERRVTELYGKAADQLGSEKAPVRLAGLYALERLAQGSPAHRQTIINLICAYLRMPVALPGKAEGRRLGQRRPRESAQSRPEGAEELEVRQAAQEILVRHLRPGEDAEPAAEFWPDIDLNLTGATMVSFVMTHGSVRSALFPGAVFTGPAVFRGTTATGPADFRGARFLGLADFRRVTLADDKAKPFRGTRFESDVEFGTQTGVALAGARTRAGGATRRKWPQGWIEEEIPGERGWAAVVEENRRFPRSG